MPTIRDCAERAHAEWTRPYCLRWRRLLTSWTRKARPFLLTAAVVGTMMVAAGNSATDRLREPLAPRPQPPPEPTEATSMPWAVEVPTRPEPAPEVFWPHLGFRDLPDLVSAAPGDEASSAAGRGAPHGESTFPSADPTMWLPLGGGVALSVAAAVTFRHRLNRQKPEQGCTDVGLALLEPDQQHASETEVKPSADPPHTESRGAQASSASVSPVAATALDPTAPTGADIEQPDDSPTPGPDTQAEPAPAGIDANASSDPPGGSWNGATRREDTASRVVLFERASGTPWGR
jgi:hypothetical protein